MFLDVKLPQKTHHEKKGNKDIIQNKLKKLRVTRGEFVLDKKRGFCLFELNTVRMYYVSMNDIGKLVVKIYKE